MSDLPTFDELMAMRAGLRQLPGWSVRARIHRFDRILHVFAGNADELTGFLRESQEPANAFRLWADDNREGFERFLDEVDRLLHNFVAAAMSLRDHVGPLRRDLLPEDEADSLASDCQARIDDDFTKSPLAQFVLGLRNVTLHDRIRIATGQLSGGYGKPDESRVVLHRSDLLKSQKWSRPAKRYIDAAGDNIGIGDVATDYRAVVVGLHAWFRAALITRHRSDLEALSQREAEVAALWRQVVGPV